MLLKHFQAFTQEWANWTTFPNSYLSQSFSASNDYGYEKVVHTEGKHLYLDGQREEVDLFQCPDLAILDKASELGDGHPLLVTLLATATSASTATTAWTTATPTGTETPSESSTASTGVCHSETLIC